MARLPRLVKFDHEARKDVLKGLNLLADAVATTLGPQGQNVAIGQPHGYPQVVHDGVTVAGNIDLFEPFSDIGAQLVKAAAQKTNDVAGDGTTTATILAQAIVNESMKQIEAGVNPMTLKRQIEEALTYTLKELQKMTVKIASDEEIEQIATIASTDAGIGRLVAEALKKVTIDGSILVEEGKSIETTVDYKQGMEIDRGFLSPYFVTDNSRVEAVIENPYILITDKKINYTREIMPFLEMVLKHSKNLVIFAGEVIEEALAMLVVNKLKGFIKVVAIQSPAYGDRRLDELEDIATFTGGIVIAGESGKELKDVTIEELGQAEKVVADRDKASIVNGSGDRNLVQTRIKELKDQLKIANTDYDKVIKEQRLANLAGKVAIINVGAATEVEVRDKKERIIDAVNATKAAVSDGIVAGGQITLLSIATMGFWERLATPGAKILQEAIKMPFRKLIENAGLDYAEVWGQLSPVTYPIGIDVFDGKKKDMIKNGIIDPVKVERTALQNAVSVATTLITTKVLIVDDPEAKE